MGLPCRPWDRGSHAPAPAPGCPGPPLPPVVLVVPDEVPFLGVHADYRPAGLLVGAGLRVEIAELGVAVGMELPSRTFALAYKLNPAERSNCRPSTNSPDVPAPSARPPACEWTSTSTATPTSDHPGYRDPPWPPRPPADPDPLRSTAYDRLHAWPAHPAHRSRPGRQIPQARCDRVRRHPGSPGDQRDPATPELSSLCPEYQPAAHPDAATARPPYAPPPPRSPPTPRA